MDELRKPPPVTREAIEADLNNVAVPLMPGDYTLLYFKPGHGFYIGQLVHTEFVAMDYVMHRAIAPNGAMAFAAIPFP